MDSHRQRSTLHRLSVVWPMNDNHEGPVPPGMGRECVDSTRYTTCLSMVAPNIRAMMRAVRGHDRLPEQEPAVSGDGDGSFSRKPLHRVELANETRRVGNPGLEGASFRAQRALRLYVPSLSRGHLRGRMPVARMSRLLPRTEVEPRLLA